MKHTFRILSLSAIILFFTGTSVFAQLTGTKNIPGDYATVALAITDLNAQGIGAGGVTFNVAAGYTETIAARLNITATGTSGNPIIFQKSGVGANPLITAYAGTATPTSAAPDGIWSLQGSDYVTIDGIDLIDPNAANPATMEYGYGLFKNSVTDGAQHNLIKNCVVTLNRINFASGTAPMVEGSVGILMINSIPTAATTALVPTAASGSNSFNSFYSNTVKNLNYGIVLIGYVDISPYTNADQSNDIGGVSLATGNSVLNYGGGALATNASAGIRTLAQYALNISYNTVNNNNGSGVNHVSTLRGIYTNTAVGASETISNNTVTVTSGATTSQLGGIENVAGSTANSNTINITNNTVTTAYPTATSGVTYGIYNNGTTPSNLNINSNTLSLTTAATSGSLYAIYSTGAIVTALNINSNTISGMTLSAATTTATVRGVYCTGGSATCTTSISTNSFAGYNYSGATGGSGETDCIYHSGTPLTETINGNTFNNLSLKTTGTIYLIYNNFSAPANGTKTITNNTTLTGVSRTAAATTAGFYCYYDFGSSPSTVSHTISGNTFSNISTNVTTTGSFYGIYSRDYSGNPNLNVFNNTISNITHNGTTGNFLPFYLGGFAGTAGSPNLVYGNVVSGVNNGSISTAQYGIYLDATALYVNLYNNTIQNNTFNGAASQFVAMYSGGSTNNKFYNNTITNITGTAVVAIAGIMINGGTQVDVYQNKINTITSVGNIWGIYANAGTLVNVYEHKVIGPNNYSIFGLSSSGLATAVEGLRAAGGTTVNFYKNNVYNLSNTSSSTTATFSMVNGISISAGTTVNANNNTIGDLRAPLVSYSDAVRGISVTSTTLLSNYNLYYNTINLSATSTGANFGTSGIYHIPSATATTSALDLRNNLVVNNSVPMGTGLTVAYRLSTIALDDYANTSNNNSFYAGTPSPANLIFTDGTNSDQTLATYQPRVSPRDGASISQNPSYSSTTGSSVVFLHIPAATSTLLESGGSVIPTITVDIDNDARPGPVGSINGGGTAPDIGADEFDGALVMCSGAVGGTITPATLTTCAGFTINMSSVGATTGPGITYQWKISTTSGGPYANVVGGSGATTVSYTSAALLAGTYYYVLQTTCSTGPVTGLSNEVFVTVNPSPAVAVTPTSGSICLPGGLPITITASGASTYAWLPITGLTPSSGAVVSANPAATTTYTVTGTGGNGCTATATVTISVGNTPTVSALASPASVCSGGSSVLTGAGSIPFTGTYCTGAYTTGSGAGDYLTNVTLGTINNTTGASASPYNTYYNLLNTNLTAGSPYTITGTIANGGTEDVAVWIDYNQDGSFDPSEKLGEQQTLTFSIPFTVPLGAFNGVTRMRVRNVYSTTGILPCSSYTYGEIEDYNVIISGGASQVSLFTWAPPTFLSATTGSPVNATGITSTTTYTVTGTTPAGCASTSTVTITSGSALSSSSTIAPSGTVCAGTNVTLNSIPVGGGSPYTYAWTGPNGFTSSAQNPVINGVTPAATGTYTVTVTDACLATSVSNVSLVVNPAPPVVVNPTSATYCVPGAPITITATGAATYTWGPATGLSATTGGTVDASPLAPTTYTVTGTDGIGCTATATVSIAVSEMPIVSSVTATPPSVCLGGNSQLAVSTGLTGLAGYNLTNITFAPVPTPGSGVTTLCSGGVAVTPLSSGSLDDGGWMAQTIPFNFSFFGTSYSSFAVSTNGFVFLGAGPPSTYTGYSNTFPSVWAAMPCVGAVYSDLNLSTGSITYFTTGTAPNRKLVINWTGAVYYYSSGSLTTQVILYESSNFVEVHTTNATGYNSAVESIQNATGTVAYPVSGRNNTIWTVSTPDAYRWAPAGGPITFAWSPATFLNNTTIYNPLASSITSSTTYTVTATNAGCSATGTVSVTAGTPLTSTASASPANTVCEGSSLTLNATPIGGGAPFTYDWAGPNGYLSAVQNPVINGITMAAAGTYTLTISDGCLSTSVSQVTITVNPAPVVAVTPTTASYCIPGPAVALTASGATTYAWGPSAGLSATTGASVNATPSSSTTYTVTGTDALGCTATATTVISSGLVATVTATAAPASICSGGNSVLAATASFASNYCQPTYSYGTGAGDYCSLVQLGTINNSTVGALSPFYTLYPAIANTTTSLVAGNTYTITLSPGTWIDNDMAAWIDFDQNGSLGDPNEKLGETDDMSSSPANTTFTFTVPIGAFNGPTRLRVREMDHSTYGDIDPCAVQSSYGETEDYVVTITGGVNAVAFAWSPATFLSSTIGSPVNAVAATTTTTYTVTATTSIGCTSTASATLTVNPLPTVAATPASSSICTGNSTTITATGAVTYAWMPGSLTGATVTVNPTTTTTYTVTGTNANGCINTTTVTITVNPLPTVTASSTAATVCSGSPVTVTGGGAVSYTWTGGVTNAVPFNPTSTVTYTVTGTDANGCTNTANTTVTVNPLPTVTANATATTVCAGTSVTLTGGGATSYTWSGGVTDAVAFVASTTTTYTVTGTDGNTCSNTATITITVNPLPVVVITGPTSVCTGSSITLTGSGASTYVWSSGGVLPAETVSPIITTTYSVTGTDANGCIGNANTSITVNPIPIVVASSSAATICAGSDVTLTGSGASTYSWSGGVTDGVPFVAVTTTTYTVTGTDANSCSNTATTTVTVNSVPVVNLGPDVAQCTGTATLDAGNAGLTYLWNDNSTAQTLIAATTGIYWVDVTNASGCTTRDSITVTINSNPVVTLGADSTQCGGTITLDAGNIGASYLWSDLSTSQTLVVSASGTYFVTATLIGGCTASDTINITINTPPTVTFTTQLTACTTDPAITLSGSPTGGTFSGPGVTGSNFTPLTAGIGAQTITYNYTDVNGCTGTATSVITVNACTGVIDPTLIAGINIYPNPNNGGFTLTITNANSEGVMEITDALGQIIMSENIAPVNGTYTKALDLSTHANGIYFLKVTTAGQTFTQKIILQK